MHVAQINKINMKKITLYISLLLSLVALQLKSQSDNLYNSIQVNTIPTNYTITAANDTTFAREVVISLIDTVNFQSLFVSLSIKTETGWQTIQTQNIGKSDIHSNECYQMLCCYRRQRNVWVINLGAYSLFTNHLVELQFGVKIGNSSSYDWSNEF